MPPSPSGPAPSESLPAPPQARRALAPFRHGVFLALWIGTLFSSLGVWIQSVGAAWLMTLIAPGAPDLVALVQSAASLPVFLFSALGGVLADVIDRRVAQMVGQIIVMTAALALAISELLGWTTPLLLLVMTFALGIGSAIRQPAFQATVGDLLPPDEVPAGVALNGVNFNIARAIGPGIGGLIVATAGAKIAFLVNAACNLATVGVLLAWRGKITSPPRQRESVLGALTAGLRQVATQPSLRRTMVRVAAFSLFAAALWALLPVVTKEDLAGDSFTYGLLLGCLGGGAVLGAAVLARLRRTASDEFIVELGSVMFALATIALATVHTMPLLIPLLLAGGVAWLIVMSTFSITVQLGAPGWVKARVIAIYFTVMFGSLALGSWFWGWLAAVRHTHDSLLVAGVLMVASLLLRWRFRMPGNKPQP
ncbi:MAG: MFS transporter [Alphaproteobacteria bacterium]|nr:MFS transporter [Alphaproteobacteria bacterium]